METLFVVVALIGLPLDWCLKKAGYPDLLKRRGDKPLIAAMARSFRCGIVTLVLLVILFFILGAIL